MKRTIMPLFLLTLLLSASIATAATRWEDLVSRYKDRENATSSNHKNGNLSKADELKNNLRIHYPTGSNYDLWQTMTVTASSQRRLAAALALIDQIYPNGNPANWRQISGFALPQEVPLPLMAVDALYVAVMELPKTENGVWLAEDLLNQFSRDSQAKFTFIDTAPREVVDAIALIARRTGNRGKWDTSHVIGTVPLARQVSGTVTQDRAISGNYQFLGNFGSPENIGPYAWDRRSGKIYRVTSSGRMLIPRP